ncbi:hypothetical protein PF002_g3359 [Phytophthora fragariae]|uniref:RxLR effector protein n=1 Tax=Phytophthora fragariae TaxID=53985 RepID=A0A6A4AAL6_9STRA|nr:hypothetical protein PF002_g3359 [Phytophthora fragariae]
MAKPSLPLLTTVVTTAIVVCRECLPGYDVDSLSHVVGLLDGYLNTFSSNWTVPRACNAGLSLRALEYLTTRDPDWGDGKDAAYVAVTKKSLHVLKWLNECYPDRTSWGGLHGRCLLNKAAEVGDLSVLQWLHANRSEKCTAYAMSIAASNGDLAMCGERAKRAFRGAPWSILLLVTRTGAAAAELLSTPP